MGHRTFYYQGDELTIPRLADSIELHSVGAKYFDALRELPFSVDELDLLFHELWIRRIQGRGIGDERLHAACDIVRSKLDLKIHQERLKASSKLARRETCLGIISVVLSTVITALTVVTVLTELSLLQDVISETKSFLEIWFQVIKIIFT